MFNITNATGLDAIILNTSANVPILFPMLLFFEFIVIALGGIFANSRRVGYSNISMWFAISGLVTTTSAFILFLVNGLIQLSTLVICVSITLACVGWFFFSESDNP